VPAGATGLQVARMARSGRLSAPRALALGMELSDLAVRPDGTAVLVGRGAFGVPPGTTRPLAEIVAAPLGPDGRPGPREVVAVEKGAAAPVVAFDPRTGRPVVAWGSEGDRYDLTLVRFAARAG